MNAPTSRSIVTVPVPGAPGRRIAVRSLLTAALVLAVAGCASHPAPTGQMAVAEAAVQRADTANTRSSASGELQIAVAKLDSARQAAARKEYVLAGQLADQAQVDAQVAMLHAENVRSQRSAQESANAADALREESARKNL